MKIQDARLDQVAFASYGDTEEFRSYDEIENALNAP